MKKRKIENEISKKKMNTKSKSDEESSNDNLPQVQVNLPNC